jgi:hypothetical protein
MEHGGTWLRRSACSPRAQPGWSLAQPAASAETGRLDCVARSPGGEYRRRSKPEAEPGSSLRRVPRIEAILERPEVQELEAVAKHHFALAAGIDHWADPTGHQAAAIPASIAVWRIVEAVRAGPANSKLPERPIYNYIVDRLYADLTSSIATETERRQVYLPVVLSPGRPPTSRSTKRQQLIDEIRARPDMADYRIKDRAVSLGVWTFDQADDRANVRRRIRRLRNDATN